MGLALMFQQALQALATVLSGLLADAAAAVANFLAALGLA